jgi:uncharacterized protein (DUF2336 family)
MSESQTVARSAGGRRREALLRHGPAGGRHAEPLTPDDVRALGDDRSVGQRARIAGKIGAQIGELGRQANAQLVEAVLELLVRDVAKEVRRALAEAVADSHEVPPSIARRLARDAIEVAEPVLRQSPLLSDDDLIGIVRTNAMQYALAVAGRSQLSEAVSEVLVDTGEAPVVARLVGNVGARLSRATLERVVAEFGAEHEVQHRMVRRPELSFELVDRLVRLIAEGLEWELVRTHRMPLEQAQVIMRAARERSAIDLVARDHGSRSLEQHLRTRFQAGELGHETLLAMLRDGDVGGFEVAVALHAREPVARVRRMLYDADRRRLAAICVRAGFPVAHYVLVRMAIEFAEAAVDGRPPRTDYGPDTIRFLQEQYQRLQAAPESVAELCGI